MTEMYQRVIQTLNWFLDNPGDATLLGLIAIIARKVFLSEIARVIQMGRDEELMWTRERVERLTGDQWNGPQPILKRVRTQYIVNYYSYLLLGSKRVYQLRGTRNVKVSKVWLSSVIAYFLGQAALKYGFTFKVEWADMAADMIITFILPALIAWLSPLFKKKEVVQNGSRILTEDNR